MTVVEGAVEGKPPEPELCLRHAFEDSENQAQHLTYRVSVHVGHGRWFAYSFMAEPSSYGGKCGGKKEGRKFVEQVSELQSNRTPDPISDCQRASFNSFGREPEY